MYFEKKEVYDEIMFVKKAANDVMRMSVIHPISEHYVLTGGFFPSRFNSEEVRDIDIYIIAPPQDIKSWLRQYGDPNKCEIQSKYRNNPNIRSVYNFDMTYNQIPIQIILTDYRTREELLADFDYKHCCVSYSLIDHKIYISEEMYHAIKNKKLIVNNKDMVADYRTQKFLKRGYTV
jgi:hypothetical protein